MAILINVLSGLNGNDRLSDSDGDDSLAGGKGNDLLTGGVGNDPPAGNDGDDVLRGGAGIDTIVGGSGTNIVQLDSTSGADLVTGFVSGTDDVRVSMGTATRIGDGDTLVEGAVTRSAANLFSSAAELVVFTNNIVGSITAAAAALKIGSATAAYTIGAQRLFVVDSGSSTAVFRFVAADADAAVEMNKLTPLATPSGTASTTTGDDLFGG